MISATPYGHTPSETGAHTGCTADHDHRGGSTRVLHVMPSLGGGGMERAMVRLIAESTHLPIEHEVCVLGCDGDDGLIQQCKSHAPVTFLGHRSSRIDLTTWRRLRRHIRHRQPNIVHARSTGTWSDAALATVGQRSVRLLLSFHGCTHLSPISRRRRLIHRCTTGQADAVVAVSQHAAQMLCDQWHVSADKLHVIHNGVDTARYRPATDPHETTASRRQLGMGPNDPLVLCVSNLHRIKNHETLLSAWRQVSMAHPIARLLIVGDGPRRDALETLARQLRCTKTIRFLGDRTDVPALLRVADLFVLPSQYEACSNAIQEALATGVATIATDVGGNPELIDSNRTGLLIRPDAPGLLAQSILSMLFEYSHRRRLGQAARASAVERFSLDEWVLRYATLYDRLVNMPGTSRVNRKEDLACAV